MRRNVFVGAGLVAMAMSMPVFAAEDAGAKWDQLYREAIADRNSGNLYGSIEKFKALLAGNPSLRRARLELAVAYYRAARYDDARKEAEKVLADDNVPGDVKETVRLFLSQVEQSATAGDQRNSFTGGASIGFGHDTNVNAGPSGNVIDIDGTELLLADGSEPQTDAFFTAGVNGAHTYRFASPLDVAGKPVGVVWQTAGSLNRREYQDEHEFTVDVVSVSTGPTFISHENWRAKLDLQEDYVRLGDNALALYSSLNPSYTIIDGKNEYTIRGQLQYREFMTDDNKGRDGERYTEGFDFAHRLNESVVLTAGTSFYQQYARVEDQQNSAFDVYAGAFWHAWNTGSVYGRVVYRETDYQGRVALFDEGRLERQPSYVVGFTHGFVGGKMDGYGIGARLSYTDNHANLDIYDYDRTDFSVNLTKKF